MGKIVRVAETQAQTVLLVRAFEEVDADGRLLSAVERSRASEDLLREGAPPETAKQAAGFLMDRAHALLPALEDRMPALAALQRASRLGKGLLLTVAALAFLSGLATDALGAERQVNLLSVPLLAILAWNLTVYLLMVVGWVLRRTSGEEARGFLHEALTSFLAWLVPRVAGGRTRGRVRGIEPGRGEPGDGEELESLARQGISRFLGLWRRPALPLVKTRTRRLLHVASITLALGIVAGMYFRGLIFEYRATWESTFLSPGAVDVLLTALLWPASALSGISVPPAAPLEAPGSGPAAPWVHLFAITTALVICVPRGILALLEHLRCVHRRRRVPLDLAESYFRRVLAAGRGAHRRVEILPYSFSPSGRAVESLKSALLDVFGSRSDLGLLPMLDYGESLSEAGLGGRDEEREEELAEETLDTDELEALGEEPDASLFFERSVVALFNLAQTPEAEVHGELLRELARVGEDGAPLAVVDASAYRVRLGDGDNVEDRLAQRRKAWSRVVEESGVALAHVDLQREPADELHAALDGALAGYPGGHLDSARQGGG